MPSVICPYCDNTYSKERADALSEMGLPQQCSECSDKNTPEKHCFMIYEHKTAPEMMVVNKGTEAFRQANAVYRRSR